MKSPSRCASASASIPALRSSAKCYGTAVSITAVGDSVNTASRTEALTKTYDCELVISEAVAAGAGLDLGAAPRHEIEIRGRVERLVVHTFASARDLPAPERGGARQRRA